MRARYIIVLLFLATGLVWWAVSAGPSTVYRILRYNLSDIDDGRIFPGRTLRAAPRAFRFRDAINPDIATLTVRLNEHTDRPLIELLKASQTIAFVVIKDDTILFEVYDHGYERDVPSLSFSMAKSVLSLLVGCALDDGLLRSIDQPVTDYLPELERRGFEAVTLRHLLQMTSGIDYAENDNPFGIHARFYYTDHLEEEILQLALREPPGRRFVYKSSDAYLLTLALQRALKGTSITEYMETRLWHPLGMEHDGMWSVDHEGGGLEKTGCCLTATARDFAKLGRLYAHKGQWNGRRIVSEDWVTASSTPDVSAGSAWDYQRMWWLVAKARQDVLAGGHLGQFLYVNPAAGIVVVRLGRSQGGLTRAQWTNVFVSLSAQLR